MSHTTKHHSLGVLDLSVNKFVNEDEFIARLQATPESPIKFILSGLLRNQDGEMSIRVIFRDTTSTLEAEVMFFTTGAFMDWLENFDDSRKINWFGVDTTIGAIEFTEG